MTKALTISIKQGIEKKMNKSVYYLMFCVLASFLCIDTLKANNYYVDNTNGSDGNAGTSPGAAWQTLVKVNAFVFAPGDSILFIRNGSWRGQLTPGSGSASGYITYSAYGTGTKPLLLGSINKSSATDWVNVGTNLWQSTDTFSHDIGNIIFNNEALVGFKKWTDTALTAQGYFWYDNSATHKVVIYSSSNPGSYYNNIELALDNFIVYAQLDSYFVLQNLAFKYGAADGIEIHNTHHAQILDCDLSYIGGGELNPRQRYGGGIQFWAYSNNNTVERCTFYEIYDDAVTNQTSAAASGPAQQYNIYYRNNLIRNCAESSFCCFMRPGTVSGSFMKNIYFENNTCLNAGGGWAASQRPDLKGFQVYFSSTSASTDSIFIRNNIFYLSRAVLFVDNSLLHILPSTTMDYNCWFTHSTGDTIVAFWSGSGATVWTQPQFSAYKAANNEDQHSIMADPLLVDTAAFDYHLNAGSPCIGAGINTGLATDFDLNPRPLTGAFDIGAYQFTTTGIQSLQIADSLKIFPEPGSGHFIFTCSEQLVDIRIFNLPGALVYELLPYTGLQSVDLSSLASGTYLVCATTASQKYYYKRIEIVK